MDHLLRVKVVDVSENRYIIDKITQMEKESDMAQQLSILLIIIANLQTTEIISMQELEQVLDKKLENIEGKLRCMSFNIANIGSRTYNNIISDLNRIESDLKNIKGELSSLRVSNLNLNKQLDDLNKTLQDRWDELKNSVSSLSQSENTEKILKMLDESNEPKNCLSTSDLKEKLACTLSSIEILIGTVNLAHELGFLDLITNLH